MTTLNSIMHHRVRRVAFLLTVVAALSAIDLVATLALMTGPGMYEANPLITLLARSTHAPALIATFKVLSVALALGLLFRLRVHWQGEAGAWVAAIVLCLLSVQWVRYAALSAQADAMTVRFLAAGDSAWIAID